MSPFPRALAFARRFAPFWLVWLLILALPASREPLKLQLLGSALSPRLSPPWREDAPLDPRFDPFALVKARPRDLNARLWRYCLMLQGQAAGFDKDGERNRAIYAPRVLMSEAKAIGAAFPTQRWLVSLPLRAFVAPTPTPRKARKEGETQAQLSLAILQNAAKTEPNNAFYPLYEARIWRRRGDTGAMWRALHRADGCRVFETHDLEWARAIVAAHESVRPLLLEEREVLWRQNSMARWPEIDEWNVFMTNDLWRARKSGDFRRLIVVGALMAHLGDLMQRQPNTLETAVKGGELKGAAWNLVGKIPAWKPKTRLRRTRISNPKVFALSAAHHGRPDVARLVPAWAARQSQIRQLDPRLDYAPVTPRNRRDAFWRAGFWRGAGTFIGAQLVFVAALWLMLNTFLWRGIGAPSTRRERAFAPLFFCAASAAMAGWCWAQIEQISAAIATRWTAGLENYAIAVASVALLAFFGAPFLLAVESAALALWQHRAQFLMPARIETELRLSRRDAVLLQSGATILCAASLVASLGLWLLFLSLVASGVTTIDPFGWLSGAPPSAKGWSVGPLPATSLLAALVYCLGLNFLGWVLWMVKWRFFSGPKLRALTHGGLRRWKEALGVYLVVGSALYFGVALWGWHPRAVAARELETRMTRGELPL